MEDLVDLLKNIIPAVIVIASLILPAFVKKKKEDKKARKAGKGQTMSLPTQKMDAQTQLEDKVRKYFNEMKTSKKPAAAQRPPRPSRPSVVEPAVLTSRDEIKAVPKPIKKPLPADEPRALSTLEKVKSKAGDDAYTVDVDAYKADVDAYAVAGDAAAAPAFQTSATKGEALTSIGEDQAPLSRIGKKKPPSKPQATEPPPDWDVVLDAASLSVKDLRKAIILREVLGPPVAIRGFLID